MNVQVLIVVLGLIIGVAGGPTLAAADQHIEAKAFLNDCIEKELSSCFAKMDLIESRSKCIRNCCKASMLKARFIIANRNQLVDEMLAKGIAGKCYRVDYYLNQRFLGTLGADAAVASAAAKAGR